MSDLIKIDGVLYCKKENNESNVKIVILDRGWVFVGRLEENETNYKLHNSSVIRRWGTTKGLGEIAKDGPTKDTILDKCNGLVKFNVNALIATIDCNEEKWDL